LSRVIDPNSMGKKRNRLTRAVVLAARELLKQPEPNAVSRDLAAFIVLSLEAISETIDPSVAAWEKRGYWVKADRFRMDWIWTGKLAKQMRTAIVDEDWSQIAMVTVQVAQKLTKIKVSDRHRMGTPWVGAWIHLKENTNVPSGE
jgi:hypothetical protein